MMLTGHTGAVRAIASLEGDLLVTTSDDGTAKVWDLTYGMTLHTLEARDVFLPIIMPTELGVVLIDGDSLLTVWDVSTGQCVRGMEVPGDKVVTLSRSARGVMAASGSRDGTARLWNLADGSCLSVLRGHTASVTSVAFSPDGTWLATASADRTLTVWHVESGQAAAAMRVESPLHVCDWLPHSLELFAAGKTGGVHLFEMMFV
jgi:WD40 repeat protein